MAISINGARFLAHSVASGLALGRTTVVGRQGLFALPNLLRGLFERHRLPISEETARFFDEKEPEWADGLFRGLGADPLEFLDVSPYEGATRIHDLNDPVGKDWDETCQTLVDAGSLEHIFDVRTAIENYLRMVRVGGSVLLLDMPAVNFCGHGFYQFSPEFFCEVFSDRHGFELQALALAPDWGYSPFYTVKRPRDTGGRVEIPSSESCHLFIRARKMRAFPGLARPIVQSDYEKVWSSAPPPGSNSSRRQGWPETMRRMWRRFDPAGYWRFSTHRDRLRTHRLNAIDRGRFVTPLDI